MERCRPRRPHPETSEGGVRKAAVVLALDSNQVFSLPVSSLVDGHPQTFAGLPSLFNIRVLLNGSDDGLTAHSLPAQFYVPPKKFPAVRSRLAMAKPKISSLVACSHFSSSGIVCTGDEAIAAKHQNRGSCFGFTNGCCRLGIAFRAQREAQFSTHNPTHKIRCLAPSALIFVFINQAIEI